MVANTKHGVVRVADNDWSFIDEESDQIVTPFGVNYMDPATGFAPNVWSEFDRTRIDKQFELLAECGGNVARVFATAGSFFDGPDQIAESALEKLDELINIGKRYDIRLIITGPDHWEGRPAFWGANQDQRTIGACLTPESLEALETYWSTLADRYSNNGTIFAWDLLNEPLMNWESPAMRDQWQAWLTDEYGSDETLASVWEEVSEDESLENGTITVPPDERNPGDRKLYDYQRFREWAACHWAERQVSAIRNTGNNHLVTIGYGQWPHPAMEDPHPSAYTGFNPEKIHDIVDFHSPHFYPFLGDPADPAMKIANGAYLCDYLRYWYTGSPIVLGEFGWYGGGAPEGNPERSQRFQDDWNRYLIETSKGICGGWLNWPMFDMPDASDISAFSGILTSEGEKKLWGKSFKEYARRFTADRPQKASELKQLQLDEPFRRQMLTGRDISNRYRQDRTQSFDED